jgi:DHA3 family macrolide efflux protein-like MFS transporter
MSAPPRALSVTELLRQRPFATLWVAQFVSIFGDFLAIFAVISLITYRWRGDAVDVTLASLAFVLPTAIVGPLAGVFVDRWNVKAVMIGSDLMRAVLVVLLLGVTTVPQVAVLLVALSTISSFFVPAQSVTLQAIVPPEGLLAANALMWQAIYVIRLLSPAAAGLLVTTFTERSCFYFDAASFLVSAVMLSTLTVALERRAGATKGREKVLRSLRDDFIAGNRFIFAHQALAFAFTAMAVAIFVLTSFSPLISIYLRDVLSAGPMWYGMITAMMGAGTFAGAQFVRRAWHDRPMTAAVLTGLATVGAGATLLGAFQSIPVAAASVLAIGFGVACVQVPAQTLIQRETSPDMMGRVSSTFLSSMSMAQALGLLLSGVLAEKLGVRQLFLACGAMAVLIAAAGRLNVRERSAVPARGAAIGP